MLTKAWIIVFLCGATLYTTDAQITGWTVPSISGATGTGASPIAMPEGQAVGATSTTFVATPTGSDTVSYSLTTSGSPFSVDSAGVLSLDTALDYEDTTSYILEIVATDNNSNVGTATVSITVEDNVAPTFSASSYTACVADASTAGQSVTTLTATDQDIGDTPTYSIFSGDTNGHFIFSAAELQVNTGATLDKSAIASYTLVVHAVDNDPPTPNTATTTVTVLVGGDCSSATALAFSIMAILMALVVSLH